MSKPYHIGTLLPEAKRAYLDLEEEGKLMEVEQHSKFVIQDAEGKEKEPGSLLPEAKGAYGRLINHG